jgi:hypothetical protein
LAPLSVSVFKEKAAQDENYVRNGYRAYRRRQQYFVAAGGGTVDRAAASILNKTKKPFAELSIHQIRHYLAYIKNF